MGAMASVCNPYALCVKVPRPLSPPGRDLNRLENVSVSVEGVFVCFLVLEGLVGVAQKLRYASWYVVELEVCSSARGM